MQNKTVVVIVLVASVVLLSLGLLFLCASSLNPGRLWLSIALVVIGGGLAVWSGVSLRRLRDLNPERVADRIVELVRRRGDTETTLADVVGSLQVPHETAEAAMGVLAGRQLVQRERRADRDVFVFPQLRVSKIVRQCPYCHSEFSVKTPVHKCPNCGASLELAKE
jgi:membrane protein implicated in regulation of membrane protease activity